MTVRALVAGAGNPFRRDDGAGPAVVACLRRLRPAPPLDLVETSGEAAGLVELWRGRDLVVVVDAARSGATPGSVHRLECGAGRVEAMPPLPTLTTHGSGVSAAISLARVIDVLPRRLVVLAVEAGDLGDGPGLSPPVRAAVRRVVDAVLAEVTLATAAVAAEPPS